MFNLFKKKPVLSDEDLVFMLETYAWLLTYFGGEAFYNDATIVLPTKEFFPNHVDNPEQAALEAFSKVKEYSGMLDWPCELERQEDDIDPIVAPTLAVEGAPRTPLGTFSANEREQITISYNPAVVGNPTQMIATFAHELAHYLTATCPEPPPGGWDNWEFATDIAATFLGFGIFMGNSAFSFQQFTEHDSQGWQSSRSGYLTEPEHMYALALFLRLKKIDIQSVTPFLKSSLTKCLKQALAELDQTDTVQKLKMVEFRVTDGVGK